MEVIDRARRPARRRMDLLLEDIGKKLVETPIDEPSITGQWAIIEDEYLKLMELDQQAREHLLTTDATSEAEEKDFRESNAYRLKVETMRAKVNKIYPAPADFIQQTSSTASVVAEQAGLKLRLPKFDLPTFDGNFVNWIGFWAQFKKIDAASNLDGSDKFNCLLSSLKKGSQPYEDIKGMPVSDEN